MKFNKEELETIKDALTMVIHFDESRESLESEENVIRIIDRIEEEVNLD